MARHTVDMGDEEAWALEGALNPTILRLHVRRALTERTIVTCPPGDAGPPLDRLLEIEGVRSIDIHRYRVRLNLRPDGGRSAVSHEVRTLLSQAWGPAVDLPPETLPRAFADTYEGPRRVAESHEMAEISGVPALTAVFAAPGVVEAVAAPGLILVRIGRLFDWDAAEATVAAALAQ